MSDETNKKLAEGLLMAMRGEHEGYHFYQMAARVTDDEKGKAVFEQLAKDELLHFHFLREQYRSILATGAPDADLKLGPRTELKGRSPIFSDAIYERLEDAHYEMTALSIGVQLELNATATYQEAATHTDDPLVKAFYLELAEWESGHYHALLAQQDALKEDYWNKSHFAPF